ncbi:MAG: hypothetical protein JRJ09_05705 [Deltaproteobacteria bacterium]|nr:hypothetical protein [Deltaproteobacteria bacterium]MBW2112988.1 hypothetical protein [Deltaproteobacteria bacterium]
MKSVVAKRKKAPLKNFTLSASPLPDLLFLLSGAICGNPGFLLIHKKDSPVFSQAKRKVPAGCRSQGSWDNSPFIIRTARHV